MKSFLFRKIKILFIVIIIILLESAVYASNPGVLQPYERMGRYYNPIEPAKADDYVEKGIASWYGEDFHGYPTSTGEIYNMYDMTAAHKTLPLGLYVKVTNLKNKKECIVRLNDRGPFVEGRIIDLSFKAAQVLDMVKHGTAPVEIEVLGYLKEEDGKILYVKPSSYLLGLYSVQVAAFKVYENAVRLKERFEKNNKKAKIVEFQKKDELFYRVRVGEFKSIEEARLYQEELKKSGFLTTFIVGE